MGDNSKKPGIRFKGFTDDWEQRKFSDIAARESFVSTSASDVPSVEYEDVVAEEGRLNKDIRLKEAVKSGITFDGSQVLYGKLRPYLHNWLNPDFKGIAVGDWWVLKPINMEKNFLYRLIQTQQFDNIANQSSGSKMPRADWNLISNSQFVVPFSKEEQSKIGGYFDNIDHLITLHQRKYDKLVVIKKSMLEKMFPKNGQTKPEIRFSGFTDDWEQRKLGEIITEYKETVDSECTLPILTSSKTEGVILQEEHFGRKQQHDITGYNILPRNYCTYRNRSDGVDFTFNINKCCDKGIISKFYPVFSGKNSDVFFLSLVLNNSDEVVREIAYTCTGTGQKVLSFLDLQKMKVRVPSYDEQKEIAAYFENLDHLITLHQRELEKLKKIKLSMLEKMFV